MNTYEINRVNRAIDIASGRNAYYGKTYQQRYERNNSHRWDYIVRMICMGCGKSLGRFELIHKLGFCYRCRKFLFPETVWMDDSGLDDRMEHGNTFRPRPWTRHGSEWRKDG